MQIFVKTVSFGNKRFALDVRDSESIESLRSLVADASGVVAKQQKLTFERVVLRDGTNVAQYAMKHGSTIDLQVDNNFACDPSANLGNRLRRQDLLGAGKTP